MEAEVKTGECDPGEPQQLYRERLERLSAEASKWAARSSVLFNLRGSSFGALVLAAAGLLTQGKWVWGWACLVCTLVLVVLIFEYARVTEKERSIWRLIHVQREALLRCSPSFAQRTDDGAEFSSGGHPYSNDLNLFGPASLFQRVSVARTAFGRRRVAEYLTRHGTLDQIRDRQAAAKELRELLDVRHELESTGLPAVDPGGRHGALSPNGTLPDPEALLEWAESEPRLLGRRALVAICTASPLLLMSWMAWGAWHGWSLAACAAPLLLHALLVKATRRATDEVFNAVSSHQSKFLQYSPMLRVLEGLPANTPALQRLKEATKTERRPASDVMRRFEHAASWFELRQSEMGHLLVNLLLLWDIHCVLLLERWKRMAGRRLRIWVDALGELEALSSLATFSFDHPHYAWPELSVGRPHFIAQRLGHPLIGEDCIENDVVLTRAEPALLVTGSNMSGKSTMLRAIGVNAVLAQAGFPVYARRLQLSPLVVRTSIQVDDSLSEGVSRFYAEIRKLKGVMDALEGEVPALYLLDEILRGTNSLERGVGARWVLAELLRAGAIGAMSTHDMGLCQLEPEAMARVRQVHFREIAEGLEMKFDYQLRPGPVRSGNALRLMKERGIAVPL